MSARVHGFTMRHDQFADLGPDRYARNARFVSELGAPVVELLAPRPGERILDLGCGDGALTQTLVEIGCEVVGVDGSAEQVRGARERGLNARVCPSRQWASSVCWPACATRLPTMTR